MDTAQRVAEASFGSRFGLENRQMCQRTAPLCPTPGSEMAPRRATLKDSPLGEADANMCGKEPISKRFVARALARCYSWGTIFTAVP